MSGPVMRKWLLQLLAPLLGGTLLLLGVLLLGNWARQRLAARDRFTAAFADIDAVPPGSLSREAFLGEVQYLAGLPDRLDLLETGLPERLGQAFAQHPWVEKVGRIELLPPHLVRVRLIYRTAVLTVRLEEGSRDVPRVVDPRGILLPLAASRARLPVLSGATAPAGPPGTAWGDVRVEIAAATADFLQPYRDRLHLPDYSLQVENGEVILNGPRLRVLWGRPPGQEQEGEAPAAVKVQRLLDYQAQHQSLEDHEHDVRPAGRPFHIPMP